MLTVRATNMTPDGEQKGLADYAVVVAINERVIWHGMVHNHARTAGASQLLRHIANYMDALPSDNESFHSASGREKGELG